MCELRGELSGDRKNMVPAGQRVNALALKTHILLVGPEHPTTATGTATTTTTTTTTTSGRIVEVSTVRIRVRDRDRVRV